MEELKTLNDFDWEGDVTIFDGDITGVDDNKIKKDLKQGAIKRIKHYLKELRMSNEDLEINKKTGVKMMKLGKDNIENLMCGAIIELVNFCDITEEDLK